MDPWSSIWRNEASQSNLVLLRDIQETVPKAKNEEGERPAPMTYAILHDMASLQNDTDRLAGSKLAKAAVVLQEYLQESGGVLLRDAREQSSGTNPKHLRPANAAKD